MSQITRCPSCATSFKVVADQLRISQGWVRCGQCNEVFDASAYLLPAAPPSLLPDVSLTDTRPLPAPVTRSQEGVRSWGQPPAPPASSPSGKGYAEVSTATQPPPFAPSRSEEIAQVSSQAQGEAGSPVLDIPQPAVPPFLAATPSGRATAEEDPPSGLLKPFTWRSDAQSRPPAADQGSSALPSSTVTEAASFKQADRMGASLDSAAGALADPATGLSAPAGYELPSAPLPDEEDLVPVPDISVGAAPMEFPALELPAKRSSIGGDSELAEMAPTAAVPASAVVGAAAPLPPLNFVPEAEPLSLVEDDSPAAVLQPPPRKPLPASGGGQHIDDEDGLAASEQEVSFVIAARRKAFWRKPMVRAGLFLVLSTLMVALALQVAVQERDRLAAMDPRSRPWLTALCGPLGCEIAPPRQIADVVIDSSAFNKARGDSYQLSVTIKNKASIPLATPAVELTLTDTQDQPVLRRVLLPNDMGAPGALPARGEWSASVSVIVTTGGARVAGYRLLAFYP